MSSIGEVKNADGIDQYDGRFALGTIEEDGPLALQKTSLVKMDRRVR